jgi:hypothetical protein
LAEAQLSPNSSDFLALLVSSSQDQLIAGRRVTMCTVLIEFNFVAVSTSPSGQSIYIKAHARVFDDNGLAFEPNHAIARTALRAYTGHPRFSLN